MKGGPIESLFEHQYKNSTVLYEFAPFVTEAEDYDLSVITDTPFGFFMTENDTMCTPGWAEWAADQIGPMMQWYKSYPAGAHTNFIHY